MAIGVPRAELPCWDDIQILTAQLATRPLPQDAEVGTELVIGPRAKRPLKLDIPLFVSDMSFGSLSREAKLALARGSAKTGVGGYLPGRKVTEEIAKVRGIEPGQDAVSPPAFTDLVTPEDFIKALALGADGIAIANSAIQAVGCVAARMCLTNRCPSGIATQDPELRKRLDVDEGTARLWRDS